MPSARNCPHCGRPLSADAPEGLCAACLFQAGLEAIGDPLPSGDSISTPPRGEPGGPHAASRLRYFGDYEIRGEIAHGGMGVVYRARQISLDRPVALKMILPHRLDEDAVRRFRQEVESAANLDHPNIVPVFEFGKHDDQFFYSMKLIEGNNLADEIPRFQEDPRASARLMATIARAVHHAHQRGVLHRDLKPQNILIDRDGQPHVTDFGLAKRMETGRELTQTGDWAGTPDYMSPEQRAGAFKDLTIATDIYSLGAIFYAMLTGHPPFRGPKSKVPWMDLPDEPARPRSQDPRIDADLETICLKCLDNDPDRRYPSAAALADDLDRWLRGEPITARPVSSWERALKWVRRKPEIAALSAAVVLVAFVGILGIVWQWRAAIGHAERERAANDNLAGALKQATFNSYVSHITLAKHEWDKNRITRARELLNNPDEAGFRGFEWHLLDRMFHRELLTIDGRALAAQLSPDGRRVALDAGYGSVKICDTVTGQEMLELEGGGASFSPDGKRVALGACAIKEEEVVNGCEPFARIRDAETGRESLTLKWYKDRNDPGRFIAFSPDGHFVAKVAGDGAKSGKYSAIVVWDATTGDVVRVIETHSDCDVVSVGFSPDSRLIASPVCTKELEETLVNVWAIETGQLLLTLKGHVGMAECVAFSPNGDQIATVTFGDALLVWDTKTGKTTYKFEKYSNSTHSYGGNGFAMCPHENRVALTCDVGVKLFTWNRNDIRSSERRDTATLKGHEGWVCDVSFSRDGRRVATTDQETVKIWDAANKPVPYTLEESRKPSGFIRRLAFSPDGRYLARASYQDIQGPHSGNLSLYDLATSRSWQDLAPGNDYLTNDLAFSPDGRLVASAGIKDRAVKLWDVASGRLVRTLSGHTSHVNGVAFSPDGLRIASAGGDEMSLTTNFVTRERTVNSASFDHSVKVWDVGTGQSLLTLKGNEPRMKSPSVGKTDASFSELEQFRSIECKCVAFSPDGNHVVSGSADQAIRVWDAQTGEALLVLRGHTGPVTRVSYSPDGYRILSASEDGTARVWAADARHQPLVLKGHSFTVSDAIFSPDGRRIATGGQDGTIKIWDTNTGQQFITLEGDGVAGIGALAFSPGGRRLAAASGGFTIKIWDATDRP